MIFKSSIDSLVASSPTLEDVGSFRLVLKGVIAFLKDYVNLRIEDGKFEWLKENGWITISSKRFRETKHLIYSGSVLQTYIHYFDPPSQGFFNLH